MKNKKLETRLKKLKRIVIPIFKRYKITKAGVFGSFVRGDYGKNSDVDILVKIRDKNMSLLGFIHIKHEIEDVLGKKVDLVEYSAIKPLIKDRILAEEIRII